MIESDTSRDTEELNVLASRCGSTEFELFELAFYDAHGYRAEEFELQHLFMQFLQNGAAPEWLRQYVRSRFNGPVQNIGNIRQSALISTGASSAIVKWRPQVDIFSFTLVSNLGGDESMSGAESPDR